MAKANKFEWQEGTGSGDFNIIEPDNIKNELLQIAAVYVKTVKEKARQKQVIDTGNMIGDDSFKVESYTDGIKSWVEIWQIEYADYVNKGVKGWASSKNAPASPYQFKSKGMPAEARRGILDSLKRGRLKVSDAYKAKMPIGLEKKYSQKAKKPLLESQANQIAYLIKKYGIKRTGFMDEAITETFKDYDVRILDSIMADIYVKLKSK